MELKDYTTDQIKSMTFDVMRQIVILVKKRDEFMTELKKRRELITNVEVTPDE